MRTSKAAAIKDIKKDGFVMLLDVSTRVAVALRRAGYVAAQIPSGNVVYTEEGIAKTRGYTLVIG